MAALPRPSPLPTLGIFLFLLIARLLWVLNRGFVSRIAIGLRSALITIYSVTVLLLVMVLVSQSISSRECIRSDLHISR
jgi:hypothetical protein